MRIKKAIGRLLPKSIKRIILKGESEIMGRMYKGDAVVCPICKSSFKAFGKFGRPHWKSTRCHECHSIERHRLLYFYLKNKMNLFNTSEKIKLLHFAPEKSFYGLFSKLDNLDYFPCDLDANKYPFRGTTKIHEVDITDIPFASNSFDLIICLHVLEHVPNDKLAMQELFRVMKKGGKGYFQVPIDYNREKTYEDPSITSPRAREKAFGQFDHVRFYGKDYKNRLEKSGFYVTEDTFINQFSDDEILKYGLDKEELIYWCEKK